MSITVLLKKIEVPMCHSPLKKLAIFEIQYNTIPFKAMQYNTIRNDINVVSRKMRVCTDYCTVLPSSISSTLELSEVFQPLGRENC
jgi:hypothetical protein